LERVEKAAVSAACNPLHGYSLKFGVALVQSDARRRQPTSLMHIRRVRRLLSVLLIEERDRHFKIARRVCCARPYTGSPAALSSSGRKAKYEKKLRDDLKHRTGWNGVRSRSRSLSVVQRPRIRGPSFNGPAQDRGGANRSKREGKNNRQRKPMSWMKQ